MDKFQRISEHQDEKLSEIHRIYGIPKRTLIKKALIYAFANPKKVWGVK
jgi:hypothetical protein